MTAPDPLLLELQAAVAGRYTVERELGRGGMGIVFLAQDDALLRPVAIKVLKPELAREAETRARFLREARTVAALAHPNIIPIYVVEQHGDLFFFVMAFVDGESLRGRIERSGPLPGHEVAALVRDMAWALGYAHSRGVVHRDVKPDNILLERATGRVLLTDFGIAQRSMEETLSGAQELVGTLQYMSPEQAAGAALDGRSDLYALGLTALFALTGRPAVEPGPMLAVLARVLNGPAPDVDLLASDAPAPLKRALAACVARDPAQRPASGDELARTLDAQVTRRITAPILRSAITSTRNAVTVFGISCVAAGPLWLAPQEMMSISDLMALPMALPLWTFVGGAFSVAHSLKAIVREGFSFDQLRQSVEESGDQRVEEMRALGVQSIAMERELMSPRKRVVLAGFLGLASVFACGVSLYSILRGESVLSSLFFFGTSAWMLLWVVTWVRATANTDNAVQQSVRRGDGPPDAATLLTTRLGERLFRWVEARERARSQRPMAVPVGAGEPTGLARVHDALQLLPDDVKTRLGDIPALADQLNQRAQLLHQRLSAAEAGVQALPPGAADRARFESARDRLAQRHRQVLEALAGIRLDLLRLGAGLADHVSITTELEKAKELSAAIDAELHGRAEVRKLLG